MTREEALKIVKEFINGTCLHLVDQEALETLIPELKENEDERVRKAIIDLINATGVVNLNYSHKQMITWLEKQKEQKPEVDESTKRLNENWMKQYFDEQKPADLSKMMVHKEPYIAPVPTPMVADEQKSVSYSPLCNTIKDKIREYVANNFVTDTVVKTDVKSIVKAMEEGVRLGKEEQKPIDYDAELEKCKHNYLYFWDKYVTVKLKPGKWSEEDEANFAWFDKFFRAESVVANGRDIPQDKYLWFKSLRPQYNGDVTMTEAYKMGKEAGEASHWKPTKEQIRTLDIVISDYRHACTKDSDKKAEILKSLLEQLNKLI